MENSFDFTAVLEISTNRLWGAHFAVPLPIMEALSTKGDAKRVVCVLNEKTEYQCAMLPAGEGRYVITVNKATQTKLGLKAGSSLRVNLRKDESEYGLPVPEEFTEILKQDEEGNRLFHALTPGKIRTLLYIVAKPKSEEKRVQTGIVILEHLKKMGGKIDFKILNLDLKV